MVADSPVNAAGQTISQENPLVTFVVPCYNSAEYMKRSIDSLLTASQPCEILIINDGSQDNTSEIAHEYERLHDNVRAIDQENANWGGVVNNGIERARGQYFKILDSDDYFDETALRRALDTLAIAVEADKAPDLFITNYVYDHMTTNSQRPMQYRSFLPVGKLFTWQDMGKTGQYKFIMIHAAWYKTSILRESGVKLPTGVSYMDSLLLLHPMPLVKTLFYLDVAPYHYIIGREGQSVEIDVVKKHIDEQILASRLAIGDIDYGPLYESEPNCAMLMTGYVSCMMSVSTIYLFKIGTPDALRKNRELWDYMRTTNPRLYANVKKSWAGRANRRTAVGRKAAQVGYTLAQKIFKFA